MAESDFLSKLNIPIYSTSLAQNTQNTAVGNLQPYLLFNNPNLPNDDKKYLNTLSAEHSKALESIQEDIAIARSAHTQEEQEIANKSIELQQRMIDSLETEMDFVNYKNNPQKGVLKEAIADCKDPVKLNQLLTLKTKYSQHLVEIQKTLASSDSSKLSKTDKEEAYKMMDFYRSNIC